MDKGIHEDRPDLFCNRCLKYVDKFVGTMLLEEDVHCLCGNWLCGFRDAFGDIDTESVAIKRIKKMGAEFNG